MTVSLFIEYNFAPIVGLIFQVIIFLFSKDYNKHDKKVLYFAFILELIELISYNIEYAFAALSYKTYFRVIFSVIGYIVRPLLVYPFISIIRSYIDKKPKYKYLDLIPLAILLVFEFLALLPNNHLVFYFNDENIFKRGPFGYISQVVTIFYLAEVAILIFYAKKGKRYLNIALCITIFLYVTLAMMFESVFNIRSLGLCSCVFSVIFFLFALQANKSAYLATKLKSLSEYDYLSKLHNRYYGETKINELLKDKKGGIFAIIDVDKFKNINDKYGHSSGDETIVKIAEILMKLALPNDVILRLGGDEFAIYCTYITNLEDAKNYIKNLFDEVKRIDFSFDNEYKIDISIGLAAYNGESDACFDDLYKIADNNLYTAKTFEGDCVI